MIWTILKNKVRPLFQDHWRHRMQATRELLAHYKATFLFWWEHRDQIKMPDLKADEAEFLPHVLSLQMTPVSPVGRWVARILVAALLIALSWSVLGTMDIVVVGQGKIIAGGYTKTIASVELAKVVSLHVQEGQSVKTGDVLIQLDARGADAEQDKVDVDRQLTLLQMGRAKALLAALSKDFSQAPQLPLIDGIDPTHYKNEAAHLQDEWRDFQSKYSRVVSQIARYSAALVVAQSRADDYARLLSTRDVSGHAYLEKEQIRIDLLGQLEDEKTKLAALITETRKAAQDNLFQATRLWSSAQQDLKKAVAHREQLSITAPVDGVVQQLTVHTVGGVVPAAQALMLIVPSAHTVELEAYVENKDIGFLRDGQDAQVKIEAFDYTKYGTLPARVTHVSRDAIDLSSSTAGSVGASAVGAAPAKGGLVYAVKVTLDKPSLTIDGKNVPLSPGMVGTVEIKTGSRRVIEYVLSPLIRHARESLGER